MRFRILLLLIVLAAVLGACRDPIDRADAATRDQYLRIARISEAQAGLDVPDSDWLDLARTICERRLLTEAEYDEFVEEMERDAPNPAFGRAVKDVGRTALQLFCPFDAATNVRQPPLS